MTLGEFVIKYRDEHDLSKRAFARMCDLSAPFICSIEKGVTEAGKPVAPSLSTYNAIASGCGMTLKELLSVVQDDITIEQTSIHIPMGKYGQLNPENQALVDRMIEALLSNQSHS